MPEAAAAPLKNCPICVQDLPLDEFGICRARKDGRNLYCKTCIRKKVTDSRRALKEYRSARKRSTQTVSENSWSAQADASTGGYSRLLNRLSPGERAKEAIRKGARTQKDIRDATGLGIDEVGEVLANLLLWTREIKTQIIDNNRHYFLNESAELVVREDLREVPERKADVTASFSAIQGLMPGRNPENEAAAKAGGWVAA
jgi:hypothetical protein